MATAKTLWQWLKAKMTKLSASKVTNVYSLSKIMSKNYKKWPKLFRRRTASKNMSRRDLLINMNFSKFLRKPKTRTKSSRRLLQSK